MGAARSLFFDSIREHGQYETPAGASWAPLRIPGIPTLWFTLFFIGQVLVGTLQVVTGRFREQTFIKRSYWLLWALEKAGARFHIEGAQHLQQVDGPVVFVGNHMSSLETVILPSIINPLKRCAFIVKQSLANYPLFGRIVQHVECIPVSRQNPRADLEKVLTAGPELLAKGLSFVIFPQSTRTDRLNPAKFGTLGVKLARKGGVPVIPVALKTDLWQPGKLLRDFGPIDISRPVHFAFGEALTVEGNGKAQHQQIIDFIQERHSEWGVPVT